MGNYLLCRRPLAETPFYIESVHLNIYSLEELCFFLSTNLAMADEVILDPSLADWLSEQCGMKNMREYNSIAVSGEKIGYRLYWLFVKSHYFTENELRKLKMRIEAQDTMSPMERQKQKGDALMRFGKYKRCIDCYEEAFGMEGIQKMPSFFQASIYHNMGCAYAKLFQSTRAAECFKKAYKVDGSDVFRDAYLRALYLEGGYNAANSEIERMQLGNEYQRELRTQVAAVKAGDLPQDQEQMLREWIREYHLSVDQ